MTARARYDAAIRFFLEGRYAQALEEQIWFHEHALEEQPGLYGVRLSFALKAWRRLADVYPPATEALDRIREREATRLLAGDDDFALFHDIVAIDDIMEETGRTHTLLASLLAIQPRSAAGYASLAIPSLLAAGEFALAARIYPDPEAHVRRQAAMLNDCVGMRRYGLMGPAFIGTQIDMYVGTVRDLLAAIGGDGRHAEAVRLRSLATALIAAPAIRRTADERLRPGALPRHERGVPPWVRRRISRA